MRFQTRCVFFLSIAFSSMILLEQRLHAQEPKLEALWADLADQDAEKAYRAIGALASMPEKMAPFLKTRLQPVTSDRKHIDKLARDLDSETFAVREKAIGELQSLSDAAEGALKEALKANPGLEARRRIENLLALIPETATSPVLRRQARTIEALEWAGTKEANELIELLAKGNSAARLTNMAKAARERVLVHSRPGPAPAPAKADAFGDPLPAGVLARLGTIRMQNGNYAAVTPDGKSLVTVADKTLSVWDTKTGRAVPGFPQAKDWRFTRAIAISPDGKLLAVAYDSAYAVDMCDLATGKLLWQHRSNGNTAETCLYAGAFTTDGKHFIIANQYTTQRWDGMTGKKVGEFTHATIPYRLVLMVSPDARLLATYTFTDNGFRIWDIATGKVLHQLNKPTESIRCAAFTDNGKRLALYAERGSIQIWDTDSGKPIRKIPLAYDSIHHGPIPSVHFSPDGATLAVTDWVEPKNPDQRIRLWNLNDESAKPRDLVPPPGIGWVQAFSPDGNSLVWRTGSSFRLLDVATGKDRHDWAFRGSVQSVAHSADGALIATGGSDGIVAIWDVATAKTLRTFLGHRYGVASVAFSPDGKTLLTCGHTFHKEPAILWDVTSGAKKTELDNNRATHPGAYWAAFSPDSKFVFAGGFSIKRGVFETATGKLHSEFTENRNSTWTMAFSRDGRLVASGIDSVCVYDRETAKVIHNLDVNQCTALAFSPDGRTLATLSSKHGVVLWEMLTGRLRARVPMKEGYYQSGRFAFSPNSSLLAWSCPMHEQGALQVWDMAKREARGPFPGHLNSVAAIAFSPDGRQLATGSNDGTVLIREVNLK